MSCRGLQNECGIDYSIQESVADFVKKIRRIQFQHQQYCARNFGPILEHEQVRIWEGQKYPLRDLHRSTKLTFAVCTERALHYAKLFSNLTP